jgi:hypothetical protein
MKTGFLIAIAIQIIRHGCSVFVVLPPLIIWYFLTGVSPKKAVAPFAGGGAGVVMVPGD